MRHGLSRTAIVVIIGVRDAIERCEIDALTPMARMGMPGTGPARPLPGLPSALETRIVAWRHAVPDSKTGITTIFATGGYVLAETTVGGTLAAPLEPLSTSDRPFVVHRGIVVGFTGDRIARMASFMNRKEPTQSPGQWPLKAGSAGP